MSQTSSPSAPRTSALYTESEIATIGSMFADGCSDLEIADALERNVKSVRTKRICLRLIRRQQVNSLLEMQECRVPRWREDEVTLLRSLAEFGKTDGEIAEIIGRTKGTTSSKRRSLGIATARKMGRPRIVDVERMTEMRSRVIAGERVADIANSFGMSASALYLRLRLAAEMNVVTGLVRDFPTVPGDGRDWDERSDIRVEDLPTGYPSAITEYDQELDARLGQIAGSRIKVDRRPVGEPGWTLRWDSTAAFVPLWYVLGTDRIGLKMKIDAVREKMFAEARAAAKAA